MDMYDPPVNLNKSEVIEIVMCDVCNGSTIAVGETDGEILLTEGGIVATMIDGADRLEVYLLLLNSYEQELTNRRVTNSYYQFSFYSWTSSFYNPITTTWR